MKLDLNQDIRNLDSPLEGKLLLALPSINDGSFFDKSLIYICSHRPEGAMGLIVNQPMPMVDFEDLQEQIGLVKSDIIFKPKIHFGGPVETARGFVLHSTDFDAEHSVPLDDGLALNATVNILKNIALGKGPKKSLLVLGYAGWGAGQLEEEIRNNYWLTLDADEDLLFQPNSSDKWQGALNKIGISPEHLSSFSGQA